MIPKIKRISDLRIDNDLTQEEMAKILKITRSKYSKIEVGILDFDLNILNDFANYFKINVDYVYGLTNDKLSCFGSEVNMKEVGNKIRELRKQKGLSQEVVCLNTGLKQSTYSRYELGIGITGYKLYILAKYYDISMDYLMDRK